MERETVGTLGRCAKLDAEHLNWGGMAVSTKEIKARWWEGDTKQRYWMELINVESWGSELIAPDTPRYDLMKDVRVGDVVLHWVGKNNTKGYKSGMYGASIVAGELK